MSDVVVVGAGISGIACARELRDAGLSVRVLDRGHRPGGRMASRRVWDDRPVDLGASYLTASDPAFRAVVDDWSARGLAREWTDTFCALGPDGAEVKTGPTRWGTPRGLRSLVEDLADGLDVERSDVADVADVPADAVVLAMPDPQARRLCGDHPVADLLDRAWEPVLALAARWPRRTWDDVSPSGRFDGAFVDDDVVAWVADDGRRRGDDAPVLVVHSTPSFAARHLADPAAATPDLMTALVRTMGLPEPEDAHVHRWTFARPAGEERPDPHALVEGPGGLVGACGDGWGGAAKVETAWLSGRSLGLALADRLA